MDGIEEGETDAHQSLVPRGHVIQLMTRDS